MRVEFPKDIDGINETDYDILREVQLHNGLWKMEITRQVNQARSGDILVDRKQSISKQAVSKRVDRLHDIGLLESSIINIDSNQDYSTPRKHFISGYRPSKRGRDKLSDTTLYIIRNVVDRCMVEDVKVSDFPQIEEHLEIYSEINSSTYKDIFELVKDRIQ